MGLKLLLICSLVCLQFSGPAALAEDLFIGDVARDIKPGSELRPQDTIGGYPIFQGDSRWRLVSASASGPSQYGLVYGTAHVVQYERNSYLAEMIVTVNLNRSAHSIYISNDPCGGEHLVKHSTVAMLGGEGTRGNCMTIDPVVVTIGNKQIQTIAIAITNTQSSSRYYRMKILLNPILLGLGSRIPEKSTDSAFAARPEMKKFIDAVTAWARQLQAATERAIGFDKPADAFLDVPSWWTLHLNPIGQVTLDAAGSARSPSSDSMRPPTLERQLSELEAQRNRNLITRNEYEARRTAAIDTGTLVALEQARQEEERAASLRAATGSAQTGEVIGTLVMTDAFSGRKTSMDVAVRLPTPDQTEYSTGDVIAKDGRVLQVRVGEAVLRVVSGSLWTIPIKEGTSGRSRIDRIDMGFPSSGSLNWRAIDAGQGRIRVEAEVSYGIPVNSTSHMGAAFGKWTATYDDGKPLPASFTAAVRGSPGPDTRGYDKNNVSGEFRLR